MGKEKNFGNKINTAGFDINPQNIGNRKPSIKKQLKDLMEAEGNLTIPSNQVINVNDDGSVVIKMPTEMQIAMKLQSWAMSRKGNDSLKAIQMIMEQIDGKPKETKDISVNREQPLFD